MFVFEEALVDFGRVGDLADAMVEGLGSFPFPEI